MTKFKRLKKLLSNEDKWTKYCCARNSKDEPVIPYDTTAVKFCLVGACFRIDMSIIDIDVVQKECIDYIKNDPVLMLKYENCLYRSNIISLLNDSTDYKTIIKIIDNLIEKDKNGAIQEV